MAPADSTGLLGSPELRWIWERVHERVLRGQRLDTTLRLADPTEAQRDAVARLLGHRTRGDGLWVPLQELEARLQDGELATDLAEAARMVLGVDAGALRARQQEESSAWGGMVESALRSSEAAGAAARDVVLAALETGLLRRLSERSASRAEKLVGNLLHLAERLPATGVPIAQLAAELTGDAHALDSGAPLGTLGVRLACALAGLSGDGGEDGGEEDRREAWARAGILCDELSAPVLALGLQSAQTGPFGDIVRAHATSGEPLRISIRQLVRFQPVFTLPAGGRVFLCENPTVVAAAADVLGPRCPPLVCTEGVPRTAVHLLLQALRRSGGCIDFHADFDRAGIRIGNLLAARHGAVPWRMSSADYDAAPPGPKLEEEPTAACWDPALDGRMRARSVAVHEESVLSSLLEDLSRRGDGAPA